MIELLLLDDLNHVLREFLTTPALDMTDLLDGLDAVLPGDGPMITRLDSGGGWTEVRRWIGRPREIGVSISEAGWTWLTSAGISDLHPPTESETERMLALLRGGL